MQNGMLLNYLTRTLRHFINPRKSGFCGVGAPPQGLSNFLPTLACPIAVALLLTGCSRQESGSQAQRGKGLPVPVTLSVAAQKDVPIQLQAIGAARAYASVSVKARVDG